jgi:hypothetical protein
MTPGLPHPLRREKQKIPNIQRRSKSISFSTLSLFAHTLKFAHNNSGFGIPSTQSARSYDSCMFYSCHCFKISTPTGDGVSDILPIYLQAARKTTSELSNFIYF